MGLIDSLKTFLGFGGKQSPEDAAAAARRAAGLTALNIYDGQFPQALKVKPGQPDDNVAIGYPTVIVDKGVSFLFGDEFKIGFGKDSDQGPETKLEELWPEETRSEDFIDMATDGGIHGDAWLKIYIEEDGSPSVVVGDPSNWSAVCDQNNYRKVLTYRCQYGRLDEQGKKVLYKEETSRDVKRWIIREFESTNEGRTWLQIGEDKFWNFEFPPIYHTKNLPKSKSFYGKADLTKNVLALSIYISRLDSLLGKTTRVHSSPKPVAKNMEPQDLKVGTDEILFLGHSTKDIERKIELLEMTGDLAGAVSFRKTLREGLAEISHVPEVATGKVENLGQLSAKALKILYGPLMDRTLIKRRFYGRIIKEVSYALLTIARISIKKSDIKLNWPDPIPTDPKEEAETSLIREQVGFSKDTEVKRLGGNPDDEKRKREEEAASETAGMMKNFDNGNLGGDVYRTPSATQPGA
jgi:Phage portal protein, SPP1 Gp6-like